MTLGNVNAGYAQADPALLWFAYPKGTSKKYPCEFNRGTGWDVLRSAGFDTVRAVAIDEDWSALRFRRVEFIGVGKYRRDSLLACVTRGQQVAHPTITVKF